MHIFIADDDPDDILFLKEAFKEISKNIKITSAKNGQELLKFVQLVIPNLIVLDINMPCMDGLDCLEELRRSKRLDHVPIIMYSTGIREEHIDRSYALGASRYIKKPTYVSSITQQMSTLVSLNMADLRSQPPRDKFFIGLNETTGF